MKYTNGNPLRNRPAIVASALSAPASNAETPAETVDFAQVPFDHPLWVLYSSGTTGQPKGVLVPAADDDVNTPPMATGFFPSQIISMSVDICRSF